MSALMLSKALVLLQCLHQQTTDTSGSVKSTLFVVANQSET